MITGLNLSNVNKKPASESLGSHCLMDRYSVILENEFSGFVSFLLQTGFRYYTLDSRNLLAIAKKINSAYTEFLIVAS